MPCAAVSVGGSGLCGRAGRKVRRRAWAHGLDQSGRAKGRPGRGQPAPAARRTRLAPTNRPWQHPHIFTPSPAQRLLAGSPPGGEAGGRRQVQADAVLRAVPRVAGHPPPGMLVQGPQPGCILAGPLTWAAHACQARCRLRPGCWRVPEAGGCLAAHEHGGVAPPSSGAAAGRPAGACSAGPAAAVGSCAAGRRSPRCCCNIALCNGQAGRSRGSQIAWVHGCRGEPCGR